MKKCPNCGKENIDEAKFCTWCRAELIVPKKKYDKSTKIALAILVVAICVCLGSIYMLFKSEYYENDQNEDLTQEDESVNSTVSAEETISGEYLAPFMNSDSKWGYINQDGEVVIECKYDLAYSFDESGCAVVGMETDSDASEYYTIYGLINTEGEEIIPLDYSYINSSIGAICDNYGYRALSRLPYPFDYDNEYSGVMDKNGNIIMSPEYREIDNIGDSGYYIACDAETGMYGIIDEDYEWVCEPDYLWINKLWNIVKDDEAKANNEYVLAAKSVFQEGGSGAGIINIYGNIIVPMYYYDIKSEVGMNRVIVQNSDEYYGAINLIGEVQIPCQYDEMGDFRYGNETYAIRDGEVFLIDVYGNEKFLADAESGWQIEKNLYEISNDEEWKIIDSDGNFLLPEGYYFSATNEKYIIGSNGDGENEILTSKTGEVINTEYQDYTLSNTVPDIVVVYDGENYGVLGSSGELIVPCRYDSCRISEDGVYITADRFKDEDGNSTECALFDINALKCSGEISAMKNGEWYLYGEIPEAGSCSL